ncbi:MAG: hypothetical protein ACFBSF_20250 [Leptolyngbyaceae cyanobacterium]
MPAIAELQQRTTENTEAIAALERRQQETSVPWNLDSSYVSSSQPSISAIAVSA